MVLLFVRIYATCPKLDRQSQRCSCISFLQWNGDCDLITIGGANKKMMFDCNFCQKAEEDNDDMYDVLDDLLTNELTSKKCGLPFLDAFLLTHPDQDHCRSFADKFYLGDPDAVPQSAKDTKKSYW